MAQATARPRPKVMTLTDAAAARVRRSWPSRTRRSSACASASRMAAAPAWNTRWNGPTEQKPFDEVVEDKGVKVLIDPKAIMFLLGTEMDFQTSALKSGFVFNNPNQTSACGCGESVQLKQAEATA